MKRGKYTDKGGEFSCRSVDALDIDAILREKSVGGFFGESSVSNEDGDDVGGSRTVKREQAGVSDQNH